MRADHAHRAQLRGGHARPTFLLPREFVVDRSGRLVLTYHFQYCDNYPDIETLVDSVREASAS
jgi:hypothetical protein